MVTCCKLITVKRINVLLRCGCNPGQPAAGSPTGAGTPHPPDRPSARWDGGCGAAPTGLLKSASPISDLLPPENTRQHVLSPVCRSRWDGGHQQRACGELRDLKSASQKGQKRANGHTQADVPIPSQANTRFPDGKGERPSGSNEREPSYRPQQAQPSQFWYLCRDETFHSRGRADLR